MKLNITGGAPPRSASQRVRYWSMAAKLSASQVGPQLAEASPTHATTMPGRRFTRLKSAAPAAIPADPPTMALFGMLPSGAKKACMEPPSPRFRPFRRPNTSAMKPYTTKSMASSWTSRSCAAGSTTRRMSPSRYCSMTRCRSAPSA